MYALHKHTKGIFSICSIQYTVNRQYHPESAVSMCVFVHYAFICTFKDICSLDTYHLIIFAAHMQISHKNSKSRCQLVYILVIDVILYYLLIFEHTLLWRLLWVYLPKNLLVCVLAEFNCCAQTTLCVNSSLVVGGIYPCVRFYVCVDWWGHSRVPGLLTTSCFPLPSAPVPSSHCSMPASFNLAVKAKENRSKSHQGTLLFFKDHAYAPPNPPSPRVFTLPSPFSPPCLAILPPCSLHFNFSCIPRRAHALNWKQWKTEKNGDDAKHLVILFVLPSFSSGSNWNSFFFSLSLLQHLNLFEILNTIGNTPKTNQAYGCLLFDLYSFSFVWISPLMFNTLQPLPLSYSRFGCVSSLLTPELVNSRFPKVWQGRENN